MSSKCIGVRFIPETIEKIEQEAKKERLTKAEWIRKTISEKLNLWGNLSVADQTLIVDQKETGALVWQFIKETVGEKKARELLEKAREQAGKNLTIFKNRLNN